MAARGRPSIDDEQLISKILRHLANGNYVKPAVEAAGMTYQGFRIWMQRGEQEKAEGLDTPYVSLFDRVTRAQADAEAVLVEQLANEQDWRAKSFLLERRHRERWGKDDPGKQAAVVIQIQPGDAAALLDALSTAKRTIPAIDAEWTPASQPAVTAADSPDKD